MLYIYIKYKLSIYQCVTHYYLFIFNNFFFLCQESNAVVEWGLNKASSSVDQVVKYPMQYIENYLPAIDQILCTSLDLTELNLPVLTKTPQQVIYYIFVVYYYDNIKEKKNYIKLVNEFKLFQNCFELFQTLL